MTVRHSWILKYPVVAVFPNPFVRTHGLLVSDVVVVCTATEFEGRKKQHHSPSTLLNPLCQYFSLVVYSISGGRSLLGCVDACRLRTTIRAVSRIT